MLRLLSILAALVSTAPAHAGIFTTKDFAPVLIGPDQASPLSVFDFQIEIPDEKLSSGSYTYIFSQDYRDAYDNNAAFVTDLPEFSLTYAGEPSSATETITGADLRALIGTVPTSPRPLVSGILLDFTVGLGVDADGNVTASEINFSGLDNTFLVSGFGSTFNVAVTSNTGFGGCDISRNCQGRTGLTTSSVPVPGGLAFIALFALVGLRIRPSSRAPSV